eukprot:6464991-Amphidinium_carterae.1
MSVLLGGTRQWYRSASLCPCATARGCEGGVLYLPLRSPWKRERHKSLGCGRRAQPMLYAAAVSIQGWVREGELQTVGLRTPG